MKPLEIKHAIENAGLTQKELAKKENVTPTAVNRVIWRNDTSSRIRKAIARVINRPVEEIWPEYYLSKASNG